MQKKIVGFAMLWLIVLLGVVLAQDFTWEDIGRANHDAQVLLVNPQDSRIIFMGVPGSVFKSDNAGESWRRVLVISSGLNNINALVFGCSNLNVLYAATDNGLYRSKDFGERWERAFRGKNDTENQCTAVLVAPYAIFVGTKSGLFISRDNGRSWQKENVKINNEPVFNIDYNLSQNKIIYLAAAGGVFKSLDSGKSWDRVFLSYAQKENQQEPAEAEKTDAEAKAPDVHFVKVDISNIHCVYFSSTKGVYKSPDQGKTWSKLTEYGLLNRDVRMFCLSADSRVFAITQTGVFLYQDERWRELSFDLDIGKINYLALDDKGGIYVAGEKGVFKSHQENSRNFLGQGLVQEYLKYEPKIIDVQKAAVKYAEVSSEKIAQWRKQAAKKALLPHLSVGLDRNTTDLWHWEGGSTTKSDDDTAFRAST